MTTPQYTGCLPSNIEQWEKDWFGYFNNCDSIDVGDEEVWDIISIRLPVLFYMATLGAMVNTDEPTAELDTAAAERVLAAMTELAADGVAVVVSSHDPRVMAVADGFVHLDRGERVP